MAAGTGENMAASWLSANRGTNMITHGSMLMLIIIVEGLKALSSLFCPRSNEGWITL
jgi:hypothetical protein